MKPFKTTWSVPPKPSFAFPTQKGSIPVGKELKTPVEQPIANEQKPNSPPLPVNGQSESLSDPHRFWKAAISRLPPEKRELAWEWYMEHCQGEKPLDTLPGLLLLLEANAAYLDMIPKEVSRLLQSLPTQISTRDEENREAMRNFIGYLENYQKQIEEIIHTLADSHQEIKKMVVEESKKSKSPSNQDELLKRLLGIVETLEKKKHLLRIWAVWFLLGIGFLGGASLFFILKIVFPKIF